MKLEMTRGFILAVAVGLTLLAYFTWKQPAMQLVTGAQSLDYCLTPANARSAEPVAADSDLILFLAGLAQGKGTR